MIPLSLSRAVICVLIIWTIECAAGCGNRQTKINGRCCDQCPPGQHVIEFCSEFQQTVCRPCKEGYFANHYNIFDRCEECQLCKEYAEKCTPTTNANCSCGTGFLCSNNVCSNCVENKCVTGEKPKKIATSLGNWLIEYSYQCEPSCPDNAYFDVKEDVCKPRTQCILFGRAEQFPGNKTHNAVCHGEMHRNGGDFIHVILGIGFVLLSLTFLVLLSYACIKNLRRHRPYTNPNNNIVAGATSPSDFHLSKEESGLGLGLIIQDESMKSNSFGLLHLEKVITF